MPKAPKVPVQKATKVVHPNSRQAMCIQREASRDQRVLKSKAESSVKQLQLQQKLLWYLEHIDPQKNVYTKHEVAELTIQYLERFKEETEQINIVNSVGNRQSKQHVARETAIKFTEKQEKYEFENFGIEVPDLVNGKNLEYFRNWTGEIKYFPNIKLKKSKKSDLNPAGNESGKDVTMPSCEKDNKLTRCENVNTMSNSEKDSTISTCEKDDKDNEEDTINC